ncbi:MAG TPA: hypothetical protein VJ455_11470 [Ignavibacteria bacterium]|nr:hypothetical protein [Ignavibacteria bacterium]
MITEINSAGKLFLYILAKYSLQYFFLSLIAILNCNIIYSQPNIDSRLFFDPLKRFSLKLSGTYISSTELQNNINSSNQIERDASTELDGGFGYAAELTYDPKLGNSEIYFFISSEYFQHKQKDLYIRYYEDTNFYSVNFEEQFYFIPIEAGIKWNLPVSGQNLKIYIGGGGGVYFGNRKRIIRGLVTTTNHVNPGYSINVLSGIDYYIARNLCAAFEFKFREAYFEVESQFDSKLKTVYGFPNPLTSRIVVNGTTLSLGLKYSF